MKVQYVHKPPPTGDRPKCVACLKPLALRWTARPNEYETVEQAVEKARDYTGAVRVTWWEHAYRLSRFRIETHDGYSGYAVVNGQPVACSLRCCEAFTAAVTSKWRGGKS